MTVRDIISALQKGLKNDEEVTLILDNSEKEFEILGVSKSLGKRSIVVKIDEKEIKSRTKDTKKSNE